uniref:NOT2/NOT3/NOT5 C-terminal domain-containing protein n=1 Tax=Setaria digitata TaxID=48799 RepID=A0A915PV69_9BILA
MEEQPPEQPPENVNFQVRSEDFPALTGTSGLWNEAASSSSSQAENRGGTVEPGFEPIVLRSLAPEAGTDLETIPSAVSNVSPNVMTDQYGMAGFLAFYRASQADPSLASLPIGENVENLGLGMNSQLQVPNPSGYGRREIYLNYGGPWADKPNHAPNIEARVPEEYRTNCLIHENLARIKLPSLDEDVVFYLFYNFPGEKYQIAAAYELYRREWRYHKVQSTWLRRFSCESVVFRANNFEKGLYNVFDPVQWRKV